MPADPIVLRVARRHAALVVQEIPTVKKRLRFTESGRISALDVMNMLEPQVGYLVQFRFRPTPGGPTRTIRWEGVTQDGGVVTGQLVLHAAVASDEVTSWGVLTVDKGR